MTNTEKRLESPRSFGDSRMSGKSTSQGIFLLECIYKGEKYTVFDSIRNKVHIIPDKHLKEIIAQALAEERKRVVGEIESRKKKVCTYEHTYPVTLGIINVKGEYEETVKAGSKQIMAYQLDDEELIYNQALDDLLPSLDKE